MELRKFTATVRDSSGKGAASRLRRDGLIPAVAYGKNLPVQALSISPADLAGVLTSERGRNTVIELDVEGKSRLTVLLREYQHHPVSRALLHADFVQIALDQPVDVTIPLETTGKALGVVQGGVLRQVFRRLPVRCLPEHIPVKVVHDVTSLELDDHVLVKDLNLPEGVSVRLPAEQTVLAIVTEKQAPEEEVQAPTAEAAAAAGAAGAAAATGAAAAGGEKTEGKADKGGEKKPEKK